MSSFPYVQISDIFNTADYNVLDEGLTIETANKLYLSLGGGLVNGLTTFDNSLSINGVLTLNSEIVDASVISGITLGTITANKVITVDASSNINSVLRLSKSSTNDQILFINGTSNGRIHQSLNGNFSIGTTSANEFRIHTSNVDRMTVLSTGNIGIGNSIPAYNLDLTGNINITANWNSNGTQILDSSRRMQNIAYLDFSNSGLSAKSILRKNTISGDGLEIYDTQFSASPQKPMLNFKTGNNDDPMFLRLCGYLNDNDGSGAYPANGCPFTVDFLGNISFDSGLRIGCINQSQASNNNANVGLWARNNTIPHFIVSDRFNQAHIKPKTADLNTQISGYDVVVGGNTVFNGGGVNEIRGNNTLLSIKNTTGGTSDRTSYIMTHNTEWEFSLGGSAHPVAPNSLYWYQGGSYRMVLRDSGRLGLGVTNPRCALEVSGAVNLTLGSGGTATVYGYNMSSGVWTNYGLGPVTATNVTAYFSNNIYSSGIWYSSSDRRIKSDINDFDISFDHYDRLQPKIYKLKNENKFTMGLIAQDTMGVFGDMIGYFPDDTLHLEGDKNDIEGVRLNIDYNQLATVNCHMIKKLIKKINELEASLAVFTSL